MREPGVVCGLAVAHEVVLRLDPAAEMEVLVGDGESVTDAPCTIARIEASARAILTAERTALNLLQRMSGIATATRRYVTAVEGTGVEILDTRKTAPGPAPARQARRRLRRRPQPSRGSRRCRS